MTNYLIQYRRTRTPGFIAGIEPPSPPSPYPTENLEFHLDANTLGYEDEESVSEWAELVSNNSPSQSTESMRPTFTTNVINGYPVVRFEGGGEDEQELYTESRMVSTYPGEMSVYMVIKITSSTKGVMLTTTIDYDSEVIMGVGSGDFDHDGNEVGILYGGVGWYMDSNIGTSAVLIAFYFNNTMATKYIYKNGSSVYNNTGSTPSTGEDDGMCIGSGFGGRYFSGDIAEVMVYSENHQDSDYDDKRAEIETYLNEKYDLWEIEEP